jgi:tripartite-type tricarboxylate transporter receptor subunit TctC
VAGQIDTTFVNMATSLPHVRAGSIKAFVVTAKNRLAIAPGIPSVDEAGLPRLRFSLWAGLFAPRGTPKNIISKLNTAAVSTLGEACKHARTGLGAIVEGASKVLTFEETATERKRCVN